MKGNRQIGLDGRIFINDCLSDGIFFVYSIILSGILGAVGDILKLIGKSSYVMNPLTNGLIMTDLACSLGLIVVAYYVYFMNCGENIPKLGVKPLIYLEYGRLAYYGLLIYDVMYRFSDEIVHSGQYPIAMSVFYVVYLGWLVCCAFAAMFILTVLNQNMIRRSYSYSFKMLALIGMSINIIMPFVFFITKIWVKGAGDGFYSAGICDIIRLGIAPIFYAAVWFLFLSAIDQIDRVFSEVDNAIRDKNYRIEFEEEERKKSARKAAKESKKSRKKAKSKKKSDEAQQSDRGRITEKEEDISVDVDPEIAFETASSDSDTDSDEENNDVASEAESTEDGESVGGKIDLSTLFDDAEDEDVSESDHDDHSDDEEGAESGAETDDSPDNSDKTASE